MTTTNGKKISELDLLRRQFINETEQFVVAKEGLNYRVALATLKTIFKTTKEEIGLGNVDNTSDLDKPLSTATQLALTKKADVGHQHLIEDVTGLADLLNELTGRIENLENNSQTDPATVHFVFSEW